LEKKLSDLFLRNLSKYRVSFLLDLLKKKIGIIYSGLATERRPPYLILIPISETVWAIHNSG